MKIITTTYENIMYMTRPQNVCNNYEAGIYKISCNSCSLHYTGETCRNLK